MTDIEKLLRDGQVLHQAGKFDMAEQVYRRALEQAQDGGRIHYLLGCLYVHAGRPDAAVPVLTEAARLAPESADSLIVLGNLYLSTGRWAEAIEALSRGVEIEPEFLPARVNLALALHRAARNDEAEAMLQSVIAAEPDNVEAHSNLAYILNGRQQFGEAETHARIAVDQPLRHAAAWNNLGVALFGLGRVDEAEAACVKALDIDPSLPQAYLSLFNIRYAQGRNVEAEESVRRAIALGGRSSVVFQQLATVLKNQGRFDEAVAAGRRAVELDPGPEARLNLALDLLLTGNYAEGWTAFERSDVLRIRRLNARTPAWDGRALDGRTLIATGERGLGDTIQFARYLPLIVERANGRIIFECQPGLVQLFGVFPGVETVGPGEFALADPPISNACFTSLGSAPSLFGAAEDRIPSGILPIQIPDEATAAWRARLGAIRGLKVGICWAGSPDYPDDHNRSMRLERFATLATIERLYLVNLQIGPPADQIHSGRHGLTLLDARDELSPIINVAALLRELDIVISVDTSMAHLAGALGVETWLLLPLAPHWCWNVKRPNDTAWYPRHRLFRQSRARDWAPVVERVRQELVARVEGHNSLQETTNDAAKRGN